MTVKFGRKHGNGYHGNTYQKITIEQRRNPKKYLVERKRSVETFPGSPLKKIETYQIEVFMFQLERKDIVLKLVWEG